MPRTGLKGTYLLTSEKINEVVRKTSPGAYTLGKLSKDGKTFYVYYVGRSNYDINRRLKQYINSKYTHFKFDYFTTPKKAFEKECRLWHDWSGDKRGLDNTNHPAPQEGKNWECPICEVFD